MTDIDDLAAGNLFVTGELGAGKTMFVVKMLQSYLAAQRPVATNLDIYLDKLCSNANNRMTIVRIPDKPTRYHLDCLGDAYDIEKHGYDESRFGLLVLDECLTWLNSRGWQDKERANVLDWFLHARKHGWNVAFLMQSASYCDPQLRDTLLTYHVSCRKMGKYKIPIIGKLFGLRLPKGTMATTYAGYGTEAIKHDVDVYRGTDLYKAYNTAQIFKSGQELLRNKKGEMEFVDMRASYTVLSAWHIKGRHEQSLSANSYNFDELIAALLTKCAVLLRVFSLIMLIPFYPFQALTELAKGYQPRSVVRSHRCL